MIATALPDVVFDEEAHTYSQGGVLVPRSATGLLKEYGLTMDYSQIPQRIMDLARQRGIAYAEGRRLILQGYELEASTIDPRIECYLAGLRLWLKESRAIVIETEIPRVSPLGYGFRADIFCWVNGKRCVVDDKATFKVPKSVGPQTAAYAIGWSSLYHGQPIEERYALHLRKDGTYKFNLLSDPDDFTAFLDCLEADIKLEPWRQKYGE